MRIDTEPPLERRILDDHNRRVEELVDTYLPHSEEEPYTICPLFGLVHRAHPPGTDESSFNFDESYWFGSTVGLSLSLATGEGIGCALDIPNNREWSVGYSINEIRTWFEYAIQAYDDLLHRRERYPEEDVQGELIFVSRLTYVYVNSFAVLEKSLKTLWAICHRNTRTNIRHGVLQVYDELDPAIQDAFRRNLHNLRFLRYSEPLPMQEAIREELQLAAESYIPARYLESSDHTPMLTLSPEITLRMALSGIVTAYTLLLRGAH